MTYILSTRSGVAREQPTIPEHLTSLSVFSDVPVTRSLVLCVFFVYRCLSFSIFLLAIVLSYLLRFMDSDYPFGIFKLFLQEVYAQGNERRTISGALNQGGVQGVCVSTESLSILAIWDDNVYMKICNEMQYFVCMIEQ